jgi:RHS repeat-associated protein
VFSYDLAGNRLTAQSGNATSTTAYNALNQITGISGGGRLRFSGTTSEPANVSVQGRAARMLDATTFTADAEVVPGVNTIPVVATDGNGNRRTNNYQVTVLGAATRAFVYDGNGNLLDDGERTYQWDAKNRLIEAKRGADTWQWGYNAFDQRVSEKKNGVVTKRWVWAGGNQPAEERDAAGNVTRRFYPQGEQAGAVKFFYTKDHLGSIREVMGANGTVVSSSCYDAWGVRTTVGAQDAASFGFTGHMEHKELGLVFTLYRAYDPATGRWLSRDPIGEEGGINLYGYVGNDPVNLWDPWGLFKWYGNWGGPGWTNGTDIWGEDDNFPRPGDLGYRPPINARDQEYFFHDTCLRECARIQCPSDRQKCRKQCDLDLADGLEALGGRFGNTWPEERIFRNGFMGQTPGESPGNWSPF